MQSTINNSLWTLSLILQIALVVALFTRHIARRVPCFTALLTFYPLRAALLFGLFSYLKPPDYATLYTTLSYIDLILQAIVAIEITHHLIREPGGITLLRATVLFLVVALAAGATVLVLAQLPTHAPVHPDRVQTFLSFIMIALFVWTIAASRSTILRPITLGLGLYASVSLFAQTGRITAAVHRDAEAYARWSYISVATYLIVVCLWFLTLKLPPRNPIQEIASDPPAAI
jgi:hypothetical protein